MTKQGSQSGVQGLGLDLIILVVVATLWSLPTLLNDLPFCYYDTRFYLYNTFHLLEPAQISWRPLTYSLFLRLPL